jgi:uncharacterized membrane protein
MENTSFVSQLHLFTAVAALCTGALVLVLPKGTRIHKRIGYVFALALVLLNLSAAFMFNLTGSFNFLHGFIIISMASLVYGMWPAIRRKPANWLRRHISGMTGAALGVWAAGFAELTVRVLPGVLSPSYIIGVAIGIGVIFFFGIGYLIYRFASLQEQYLN